MDTVYVNNFRGFSKTTIPISPVNFFVGENSTGKSSILGLVSLFGTREYWSDFNFNISEYSFGGFKDIVSVSSEDKKEFQVGVFTENENDGDSCFLFHFKEGKNGLASLSRISYMDKEYCATLRITKKTVSIRFSCELSLVEGSKPDKCFEDLINFAVETKGYKFVSKDLAAQFVAYPIFMFFIVVHEMFTSQPPKFNRHPHPVLSNEFASLAPIRTKPKRTYDGYSQDFNSEGEHTPYIIKANTRIISTEFKKSLDAFGKESGLYQHIDVSQFGNDNTAPFEIIVDLGKKCSLRVNSVGYGVSQVLPVVVELLDRPNKSWFSIQQPEVHLHPRAQAALGDLFFNVSTSKECVLFVETHSDYLMDRFRLNFRNNKVPENFCQILFFERNSRGNKFNIMRVDKNGELPDSQPKQYREFFLSEQRTILGL